MFRAAMPTAKKPRRIATPEERKAIREAYGDGSSVSLTDVSRHCGFSPATVASIVNNEIRAKALEAQTAPPGEKVK